MTSWLQGLAHYSFSLFQDITAKYSLPELSEIRDEVDELVQDDRPPMLGKEKYNFVVELMKKENLSRFCESGDPTTLFYISDWAKDALLKVAPLSLAVHGKLKDEFAEKALYVLDILSETQPLDFPCAKFEPLQWVGSSCYVDSDLMALLAVPNLFVTETILNADLVSEPPGRPGYACAKKPAVGEKADPAVDLINRKKVQSSLNEITKSLRGTGTVPNCTSLRKILAACPHPEEFHLTGSRDAGEYLGYILSMFPATQQAVTTTTTSVSKDGGVTWKVISSDVRHDSVVWDVLPATLKAIPSDKSLTIGALLEDIDVEDMTNGSLKETNTTLNTTPFLVLHANRADPTLEEDDENFMIATKILPTEHITFLDGSRLAFSGVVMWKDYHYTAYIRCGTGWYYYDDGMGLERPISYMDMITYIANDRPGITTNGTLYFYARTSPIDIPVVKE